LPTINSYKQPWSGLPGFKIKWHICASKTETNPVNYRASVSGFLAEIDRMQLEVREYFSFLPPERTKAA